LPFPFLSFPFLSFLDLDRRRGRGREYWEFLLQWWKEVGVVYPESSLLLLLPPPLFLLCCCCCRRGNPDVAGRAAKGGNTDACVGIYLRVEDV
jgi:hypothetical protein